MFSGVDVCLFTDLGPAGQRGRGRLVVDSGSRNGVWWDNGAAWVQMLQAPSGESGFTFALVEGPTAPVTIAGTSQATATTVLSFGAVLLTGEPVRVEVASPALYSGSGASAVVTLDLYDTVLLTSLGVVGRQSLTGTAEPLTVPFYSSTIWRPDPLSYTLAVRAWVTPNSGSPSFGSGDGGQGGAVADYFPAYARISRV